MADDETSDGQGPQPPQLGDTELANLRKSVAAIDEFQVMTIPHALLAGLINRLDAAETALQAIRRDEETRP